MPRYIAWLSELGKEALLVAGGKGAHLAELYNQRLPVPPAFVVTVEAYTRFLEEAKLREKIAEKIKTIDLERTAELEKTAKEIQATIVAASMPADVKKALLEAYEELSVPEIEKGVKAEALAATLKAGREAAFVAVRSSATTEDLAEASFAGQQETFLNVKGNEALIEAVKKCWASLFTARAIYYRARRGFKAAESYIAVIVQRMVNSDAAGVIFTCDPVTGDKAKIVIEACYGLGEGVVSGATKPDRYVIRKDDLTILSKHVSEKTIYFTRSAEGKNVRLNVPPEWQGKPVLSDTLIREFARLSKQIEDYYNGVPQDIEFAVEANRPYILQTRPVTTVEKKVEVVPVEKATVLLEGLAASPGLGSGEVALVYTLEDLSKVKKGNILVTKMTNPDMVVTMQRSAGIVTDEGGYTAHAAIVSREMGLPCVVGTLRATKTLKDGQTVTVDGSRGKVYSGKVAVVTTGSDPRPAEPAKPTPTIPPPVPGVKAAPPPLPAPALPAPGVVPPPAPVPRPVPPVPPKQEKETPTFEPKTRTKIYMNLSEPGKISDYRDLPFDGIGLMRIEFTISSEIGEHPLYLLKVGQEQRYIDKLAEGIATVAKAVKPRPVVVRFSDFKTNEYRRLKGGEEYEFSEANPMMGFRGVSRYIAKEFVDAFRLECKAIRKVREEFDCDNVWVMLPFVRLVEEVPKVLNVLREEGLERSENFKIWLMAEVPSMALTPDRFAELPIDGTSIGSNDLTQFVLGVDRDSAILARMGYFDERKEPVKEAIRKIIEAFKKAGKTTSICGQAPSVYLEIVEFLVRQGVTSISVNPDVVEKVRKQVAEVERKLAEEKTAGEKVEAEEEEEESPGKPGLLEEKEKASGVEIF